MPNKTDFTKMKIGTKVTSTINGPGNIVKTSTELPYDRFPILVDHGVRGFEWYSSNGRSMNYGGLDKIVLAE